MNIIHPKTTLRSRLIVLFLMIGSVVAISSASLAEEAKASITVSGHGGHSVKPDMAMITLGVQRQAKTARQALNQNNAAMAAVLSALKAQGIEDKDLQTSGFNIQPHYHYPKRSSHGTLRPPIIIGYIVSNQLGVRIRDLTRLGDILDKSVTLGVNSGGNIRFLTENPETAIIKARQKAMASAVAKAKTLTEAAGISLGKIMSINENSNRPRPLAMRQMAMAKPGAAESVPVAAGENAYTVDVQVRWELLQ